MFVGGAFTNQQTNGSLLVMACKTCDGEGYISAPARTDEGRKVSDIVKCPDCGTSRALSLRNRQRILAVARLLDSAAARLRKFVAARTPRRPRKPKAVHREAA